MALLLGNVGLLEQVGMSVSLFSFLERFEEECC